MSTKIIPGIIAFALHAITYSQMPTLNWSKALGGSGTVEPYVIAVDGDGSVITAGELSNLTADFNPGAGTFNMTPTPPSNIDMFISKLDENGNFVWAKQLPGLWEPRGVKTDAANNIYITGYYEGDEDFDPGAGVVNLDPAGGGYVLKLNASGNFVAAYRIAEQVDIFTLYVSDAGDIYTGGRFYGTNDFDPGAGTQSMTSIGNYDYFISHLDPSGNLVWAGQGGSAGSSNTMLRDLTVDNSGNIYCTGTFENTTDMDPGTGVYNMTTSGYGDVFVSKINTAGDLIWSKQMGGSDHQEMGRKISRDAIGNIYVGGTFSSTNADFDPGSGTYLMSATYWSGDFFFVKLDPDGNFNWATTFTSTPISNIDYLTGREADDYGNLYVTGYMEGTMDFDPGAGTYSLTSSGYASFNFRLNTSGELDYAFLYDAAGFDFGQGLALENNTLYLTGAFVNTIDFDPGSGTSSMNAGSTHDTYVVKLNNCQNGSFSTISTCGNYTWSATGLTYSSSGIYTANLTNVAGCDSTVVLYLTVNSSASGTDVQTACNSFTWIDGITYTSSTNLPAHTIVGGAVNGCDSTVTLNLTIEDTENPVPDAASLSNVTAQCQITGLTAPTATDNCAGTISGIHNATLPITAPGTTVVTWTYDDGNGNTITQNQNIIIDDNTNPVADAVTLADITNECEVTSLSAPTATDNCAGTLTGTHNATLPITTPGTTVVTWTYDDGNGNMLTQNQNVIISPIDNGITQMTFNTLAANASGYTYQWIDCNNGNAIIPGANGQQYTASSNGSYAVEISNGSCSVLSTCLNITALSINEKDNQNEVTIFPNPNNGNFEVSISGVQNQTTGIELLDMSGKIIEAFVLSGDSTIQLTYDHLEKGVYLLRIQTGNDTGLHKVVIQ